MPRDGSGVYSAAWVNATPNTTIESSKQNALVADLVTDANAARPITAGGTGETTARLKDGTWRFQNTADTTKLLALDLSGIGTGTTRTVTVPNSNGTMSLLEANQTISGVRTYSSVPVLDGGGVRFPATQVPSANANTLDDYEEGTWVANITFATPGNLSVSYSVRNARYVKVGRLVTVSFDITTSVFSHTTASGALRVTGLPFTALGATGSRSGGYIGGYTKANYTMVAAEIFPSTDYVSFIAAGSGQSVASLTASDMPTAGTVSLYYTITYEAAA